MSAETRFRPLPSDPFGSTEAGRAHLEEHREELEARGKPFGLSAAMVVAADGVGMELAEYAAFGAARTIDDYERVRTDEKRRRTAAEQARLELDVEAAKKAVSS